MNAGQIREMEAGRELDALVAEKVMGWTMGDYEPGLYYTTRPGGPVAVISPTWTPRMPFHRFLPSTDIAAAWEVVERLYDLRWIIGLGSLAQNPRGWRCELCNMWEDDFERAPSDIEANADTAPLAICRAALLAVMVDES